VALVGEPGVGKSRLVWEFSHSHRTQGWLVLASGSVSYGKATSYLPAIELLKAYCGIEARDDARRIREKLTGKVLTLDPALQPTLPALLALLDVAVDDPAWQALDPPQRRQRTLDALKRLILRESQEQPLLLVFEDLHWIDAETQALLDSLVESLPTARLLLLVNYRPEYEHTWHRKTYYQQLRLDPLPPEGADELLDVLMGTDRGLLPLKRLLSERTEGNPFFLEESVRSLVETGALIGERGRYQLAKPVENTQAPATVQAVLAARIDRLAPEQKRLLQCAAVIGKDVPFPLLQVIAELREDWLRQGLADLQGAEFLYETSLFPDQEYTFKHALTHEVAYGSVLQDRRRALHARIVDTIETLYPDRLAEYVERLAHHALRGEVWEKAVEYLQQAGVKAQARSAYREAIVYLEQALGALERLPQTRQTRERAIDLRLDLRSALFPLGVTERVLSCLGEAEVLAEELDDRRRLGRVLSLRANIAQQVGDYRAAMEIGERALAIALDLADVSMQVSTCVFLARAAYALGQYQRGIEFGQQVMASLRGDLEHQRLGMVGYPAVTARTGLAISLVERGELADALAYSREGLHLAEKVSHPLSIAGAACSLGLVYLAGGDLGRAVPVLERAAEICEARSIRLLVLNSMATLAYAYALSGRAPEALRLADRAVAEIAASGEGGYRALPIVWLGEAYLLAGRRELASPVAAQVLTLTRDHHAPGLEAWALWLLGEIAAAADPIEDALAERHYSAALARAEELGQRLLRAHCHLGLGTLYQKAGRYNEAQAELSAASEMYRAMEMPFWLARVEGVRSRLIDPEAARPG
jgi:predicted ATPase